MISRRRKGFPQTELFGVSKWLKGVSGLQGQSIFTWPGAGGGVNAFPCAPGCTFPLVGEGTSGLLEKESPYLGCLLLTELLVNLSPLQVLLGSCTVTGKTTI